ncbi:MAG TPA: hypothetical protein VFI90_02560 [Rubrobacter sp.]|nr:hypothetical protein [Rubrobacter sp.]
MRERLEQRLQELKVEFGNGEKTLQDLETQVTTVRQTLLRISGAIQVLEEELGHTDQPQRDGHEPSVQETGAATGPAGRPGA